MKAFGSLGANALASGSHRGPRRAVFFYATDDAAAQTTDGLIRAELRPLEAGRRAYAGRIEAPGGDLNGNLLDLDRARSGVAATHPT
jgi:8-hydroxy-5-deazaflavin:NADPH oxidoreductase